MTRQLDGITLRSALNLMLSALDLTYVIEDEVLLITTPDVASRALVTKIYPVGDLLAAHEGKAQAEGFKALTQAIRSTIRPNSWSTVGGPADVVCVPEARRWWSCRLTMGNRTSPSFWPVCEQPVIRSRGRPPRSARAQRRKISKPR